MKTIDWPGRGPAFLVTIRGMSDYVNMNTWKTQCGAKVKQRNGKWQAQFKCHTSVWHDSPLQAMIELEAMIFRAEGLKELTRLTEEYDGYEEK